MTAEVAVTPVKGMVWTHATRKDYEGKPRRMVVTSVVKGVVYSQFESGDYGRRIKTPLTRFNDYLLDVVSVPEPKPRERSPRLSDTVCQRLFDRAHDAGMAAGQLARPVPMNVVQRANPFDDNSPIVRRYEPVMDGACGFAWIVVRPGNSSFARWLVKNDHARAHYRGGVSIYVGEFNQSMERKEVYAHAFSTILGEIGISAYVESRLD